MSEKDQPCVNWNGLALWNRYMGWLLKCKFSTSGEKQNAIQVEAIDWIIKVQKFKTYKGLVCNGGLQENGGPERGQTGEADRSRYESVSFIPQRLSSPQHSFLKRDAIYLLGPPHCSKHWEYQYKIIILEMRKKFTELRRYRLHCWSLYQKQ